MRTRVRSRTGATRRRSLTSCARAAGSSSSRRVAARSAFADALDVGADALQLLLDAFVAAVDVVDAPHVGVALGDEARQHEAGRRAQIAGHHRRAAQVAGALDDRARALAPD